MAWKQTLNVQAVQSRHVDLYGFSDFVIVDILVGSVRTSGVSGTNFQRRPWHQRLVAQRRRTEWVSSCHFQPPDYRVAFVDRRRT